MTLKMLSVEMHSTFLFLLIYQYKNALKLSLRSNKVSFKFLKVKKNFDFNYTLKQEGETKDTI